MVFHSRNAWNYLNELAQSSADDREGTRVEFFFLLLTSEAGKAGQRIKRHPITTCKSSNRCIGAGFLISLLYGAGMC